MPSRRATSDARSGRPSGWAHSTRSAGQDGGQDLGVAPLVAALVGVEVDAGVADERREQLGGAARRSARHDAAAAAGLHRRDERRQRAAQRGAGRRRQLVEEPADLDESGPQGLVGLGHPGRRQLEQRGPPVGGVGDAAEQAVGLQRVGHGREVAGREPEPVGERLHLRRALAVEDLEHAQPGVREPVGRAAVEPPPEGVGEAGRELDQLAVGDVEHGVVGRRADRWRRRPGVMVRGYRGRAGRECVVGDTYRSLLSPPSQPAPGGHHAHHPSPHHRYLDVRRRPLRRPLQGPPPRPDQRARPLQRHRRLARRRRGPGQHQRRRHDRHRHASTPTTPIATPTSAGPTSSPPTPTRR